MKYLIVTASFISLTLFSAYKAHAQTDSSLLLRDSIYNFKANYIGQPLMKLINALKGNVGFFLPDNIGGGARKTGTAYYQNITLLVGEKTGFTERGFKIALANKVTVDLAKMKGTPYKLWDNEMIGMLGSQNVVSIAKFQ